MGTRHSIAVETLCLCEELMDRIKAIPDQEKNCGGKYKASAKRCSMDLTRQLALFRKTWDYEE